jgi:hypothetical protein
MTDFERRYLELWQAERLADPHIHSKPHSTAS